MKLPYRNIALVILLVISFVFGFKSHDQSVKNELLDFRVVNLMSQLNDKIDSLKILKLQNISMQHRADSIDKIVSVINKDRARLRDKLKNELTKIDSIPANESADFLRVVAHPDTGILIHPFSDKQVVEMRKDYVNVELLKEINDNLENNVVQLVSKVSVKDSLISNQVNQINGYVSIGQSYRNLVQIKDTQIKSLDKQIKRKKVGNVFWTGTTLAEALFIIIRII